MRNYRPLVLALLGALVALPVGARAAGITVIPATAGAPAVPVYVAEPPHGGPAPAVVILHGCEGFNGFYAVAADRLAALGYVAVAVDAVGPSRMQGECDGGRDGSRTEAAAARAALAWLRTQPYVVPDRLALMGFSMGGAALLDVIDAQPATPAPAGVRAAVAFYPPCGRRSGAVAVPLAIFDGGADQITPAAPCAALAKAGAQLGKTIDLTTYPNATHGFAVPAPDRTFFGQPIRYDRDAALDAAHRTLDFFARYLQQ